MSKKYCLHSNNLFYNWSKCTWVIIKLQVAFGNYVSFNYAYSYAAFNSFWVFNGVLHTGNFWLKPAAGNALVQLGKLPILLKGVYTRYTTSRNSSSGHRRLVKFYKQNCERNRRWWYTIWPPANILIQFTRKSCLLIIAHTFYHEELCDRNTIFVTNLLA